MPRSGLVIRSSVPAATAPFRNDRLELFISVSSVLLTDETLRLMYRSFPYRPLLGGPAAVDEEGAPGDERGCLGSQKDSRSRYIPQLAPSPHRDSLDECLVLCR